jgi:hypothetical protein
LKCSKRSRSYWQIRDAVALEFDRDGLAAAGFTGWQTWADLRSHDYRNVPRTPAAYVVYRDTNEPPSFSALTLEGTSQNKDPKPHSDWCAARRPEAG